LTQAHSAGYRAPLVHGGSSQREKGRCRGDIAATARVMGAKHGEQTPHLFNSRRLDRQSGHRHVGVRLFASARDQRAGQNGHSRLVRPGVPLRCGAMESGGAAHRRAFLISSGTCTFAPTPVIVVVAYSDDASGVEIDQSDGAGQFESVTLRPHAKLAAGSDENVARHLHDAAAEQCFIARSVAFKVNHYPTFEISVA
jgi:hypothetical protein